MNRQALGYDPQAVTLANGFSPSEQEGSDDGGVRRRHVIRTSPYSVFVHDSPVYRTSMMPMKRSTRLTPRPHSRHRRRLPLRLDPYPYADAHWSAVSRGGGGAEFSPS
ncbi:MAG TPA: hypothetical protein ENI92_08775 [Bacteroidetes bacterium]|nr:hypothetical protein [Bacteroidota bacterium]